MTGVKKKESLELEIDRLAFGGRGVGRTADGFVVFVEDALPGQRVRVYVYRVKSRYAEARLEEVLRRGPDQIEPRCPHFGPCGGCRLQHLDYPAQVRIKGEHVAESLARIGAFIDPPVEPARPSPQIWGYRNKMEYSFGEARWLAPGELADPGNAPERDLTLGLHPRGRWNRILRITECHLAPPLSAAIMSRVRTAARASGRPAYSTKTHTGFWRFLVVRRGVRTDEWMVDLITNADPRGENVIEALVPGLTAAFPEITTITHTVNRGKAAVATGERMSVLHGAGYIEEEVGGLRFRLSPRSFFQTNTEAAEELYAVALDLARIGPDDLVWDLYSGTGTIALLAAARAGRVVGLELEPQAVADARANARLNALANVEFVAGDVVGLIGSGAVAGEPGVVIVDPPRAGLHPEVRAALIERAAPRLVYISCNPATLAADLKELCGNRYELRRVVPLDMFPHTPHVESVSLLTVR